MIRRLFSAHFAKKSLISHKNVNCQSMSDQEGPPSSSEAALLLAADASSLGTSGEDPRLYGRRWAMLGIFFGMSVASNGINLTFGPIDRLAGTCFQQSAIVVNGMSGLASLSGAFLLLPSLVVIKSRRVGLQRAVFGLAVFQMFCGILRIVTALAVSRELNVRLYFWLIFTSQLCVALPVAFLTSLPVQISTNYFGVKERSLATSIGALAQMFGLAAGQTSGYVVTAQCGGFRWLFIGQGIFCVVTGFLGLFLRIRPPSAPTLTSEYENRHVMSLGKELKHIAMTGPMRILLLLYACGMGTFVVLWSSLQEIVPNRDHAVDVSLIICFTGIFGGVVAGVLLDKLRSERTYKVMMLVSAAGGSAGMALFAWSVQSSIEKLTFGSAAILGFFLIGMTPVAFELAQELVYPVSSTTSTAVLLVVGNLVGIGYIIIFSLTKNRKLDLIIVFGVYALAQLMLIFLQPKCKRMEAERLKQSVVVN